MGLSPLGPKEIDGLLVPPAKLIQCTLLTDHLITQSAGNRAVPYCTGAGCTRTRKSGSSQTIHTHLALEAYLGCYI